MWRLNGSYATGNGDAPKMCTCANNTAMNKIKATQNRQPKLS